MNFIEALIIDPNPFTRNNLWQATLAESSFRNTKTVPELKDASAQLSLGMKYDLFLITSEFSTADVNAFIAASKSCPAGQESAFVLVMKQRHQNEETVVDGVIEGLDGFLFEPFNVDSLKAVSVTASKVRQKHQSARARAAMKLILDRFMPVFEDFVRQQRRKRPGAEEIALLRKHRSSLKRVLETDADVFFEVLDERMAKGTPRVKVKAEYHGASERVRKMIEKCPNG